MTKDFENYLRSEVSNTQGKKDAGGRRREDWRNFWGNNREILCCGGGGFPKADVAFQTGRGDSSNPV